MGWNSWDSYGLTIDEEQYMANAKVLSTLQSYGWKYAVIDEGWYLENPLEAPAKFFYNHDGNGRLIPAAARFPSSAGGRGFKSVADRTHTMGLSFGIHIVRGIPKEAVRQDLPIANSAFKLSEAADTADTCPWNPDNFGVKDNPAGRAYYDSIISLYASWGVDFLKVDCISDHPYKGDEIRMIARAIAKSGRPIALSLSPGPTSLSHAEEVSQNAQMWRIADDIWDGWDFPGWPKGLHSAFDNLAAWSKYSGPGHWPDADMLPWGMLSPNPGWGKPRRSRLTEEEVKTQFTLWAIARTPMILGANLTELDPFTLSLLKQKDLIELNQRASHSAEVLTADDRSVRVWSATIEGAHPVNYIAVFNLKEETTTEEFAWSKLLGVRRGDAKVQDVWQAKALPSGETLRVELAAHGVALFRLVR